MEEQLRQLAQRIVKAGKGLAFTGAGISVESGIPDFRSRGGLWERFDPAEYATIDAFRADPAKVWHMLREMDQMVSQAEPNPAHLGLARLEELGFLDGVITQNVDALHQRAGSKTVIEFHGNSQRLLCLQCCLTEDAATARTRWAKEFPPRCPRCGAIVKPDVVMFGEAIDPEASARATRMAQSAAVMLVVGTSGMVAPASYLPIAAKQAGAFVAEIDLQKTVLTGQVADISLQGRAGELVPRLVAAVEQAKKESNDA